MSRREDDSACIRDGSRRSFLTAMAGGLAGLGAGCTARRRDNPAKPNVLFISVDDMRDWTAGLGGYAGDVHTPNQERLASRGVRFTNAHCASTVCNPSRTAIMLGLRPSTTGVYNNGQWWRPAHPDVVTIPMHFRANGHYAAGAGKVFHHTAGFNPPDQWDEFTRIVFDDPWDKTAKVNYPWVPPAPAPPGHPFNGLRPYRHEFDWGVLEKPEHEHGDALAVDLVIELLRRDHEQPSFLAAGIFHPHLPWYVPRKYLDLYPLESIRLPEVPEDDLRDIPPEGQELARARREDLEKVLAAGKWKELAQAYLASITFADAQLGRLLDALDASGRADNTVIIFWSDHGWHLGEKSHLHKSTLWEEATRVPFMIAAPGITTPGTSCSRPVGLIDIYPTLNEICGLAEKPELDGHSLVPLLRDPSRGWEWPAVTTYQRGQHAVRDERWRYIRYSDGTEELYDHASDPNEWNNVAAVPENGAVKQKLAGWIPANDAEPIPSKNAYIFDPETYTWERRVR